MEEQRGKLIGFKSNSSEMVEIWQDLCQSVMTPEPELSLSRVKLSLGQHMDYDYKFCICWYFLGSNKLEQLTL